MGSKYCPNPDECTYSDCPTAFCDRNKTESLPITLKDKSGRTITVPADTTIEELVKMGIVDIGIVDKTEPMKDFHFRNKD